MSAIHELSAMAQRQLLAEEALSPVELATHYLDRIEAMNPTLRAFTTVTHELALERAKGLGPSADLQAPLWGLPLGDKDLGDRAGVPTSFGSLAFGGYVPAHSSPIVQAMDAAGGVSLGKTNAPELGFPAYGENRLPGGPARNPWDLSRDPGGSSSGAAVAVAAGLLPFAPGSDGGGSVRIPAAACGLVGLKTSRGRIPSASGIDSLGGLVVGGPITRTVADAALLLDGMRTGHDRFALHAPPAPGPFLDALSQPVRPLRIGWNLWSPWSGAYAIDVDPPAVAELERVVTLLERLGHRIQPLTPRPFPEYVDAFRAVWMGGAASVPLADDALDGLEPLTSWLIRTGRKRPAAELPAALSALARFETQLIDDYAAVDVVLTPSLAMTARPLGWFDPHDGERNFEQQCQFTPFTSYLNVAGLPAITLPTGETLEKGVTLPLGVQAIGRPGDERTLLQLGQQLEREIEWASRKPPAWDSAGN